MINAIITVRTLQNDSMKRVDIDRDHRDDGKHGVGVGASWLLVR